MTSEPESFHLSMSPTAAWWCLAFALLGLGASTAAGYVHYRILADPTYLSFCDISATFSSTQVYSSRFGTWLGISVTVFGATWFGLATLLSTAGLVARPEVNENVPGYLFAGSTLGLAAILHLGYSSFFVLQPVSILCLVTYAAVIGLFTVSGAATKIPMTILPSRATLASWCRIPPLVSVLRQEIQLAVTGGNTVSSGRWRSDTRCRERGTRVVSSSLGRGITVLVGRH